MRVAFLIVLASVMLCLTPSPVVAGRHLLQDTSATAVPADNATAAMPAQTAAMPENATVGAMPGKVSPTAGLVGNATGNLTYPTLADAVVAANTTGAANMSILIAAVEAANLTGYLNATTAWTIFAPNNSAFEALLAENNATLDEFLNSTEDVTAILAHHIVPTGAYFSSNLTNGMNLSTAANLVVGQQTNETLLEPLTVVMDNTTMPPTVNITTAGTNATVLVPDIVAGNSVIHVINNVLLPTIEENETMTATGPAGGTSLPGAAATTASPEPSVTNTTGTAVPMESNTTGAAP